MPGGVVWLFDLHTTWHRSDKLEAPRNICFFFLITIKEIWVRVGLEENLKNRETAKMTENL